MSADYFWTIVLWSLGAIGFFGSGAAIVWAAFDIPIEDEGAAR